MKHILLAAMGTFLIGCSVSVHGSDNDKPAPRGSSITIAADPPTIVRAASEVLKDANLQDIDVSWTKVDGKVQGQLASREELGVLIERVSDTSSSVRVVINGEWNNKT